MGTTRKWPFSFGVWLDSRGVLLQRVPRRLGVACKELQSTVEILQSLQRVPRRLGVACLSIINFVNDAFSYCSGCRDGWAWRARANR
jgi:hypothetical protein